MAIDVSASQALFDNSVVPLVVRTFDATVEPARGITQPIIASDDGSILVTPVGPGLTLLQTVDLTANDYNESAGELAPFSAAINWAYDPDNVEYMRLNGTRETSSFSGSDLRALNTVAAQFMYNGTVSTWFQRRGNENPTILPSQARTASTSDLKQNPTARSGHFIIDITAITGSPSITIDIEAEDIASGKFYPLLTSNALSTVGTTILKIGPGYVPVPNLTAADNLPFQIRVSVTNANADSITYSVGANFHP